MDIYLIDQIMKDRYAAGSKILDAGCGSGRNLNWFVHGDFELHAVDLNPECPLKLRERFGTLSEQINFVQCPLSAMPYKPSFFDHIICNAVIHFVPDYASCKLMFSELVRVLKPGGSLFVRTCSDIGIGTQKPVKDSEQHLLADESLRWLISRKHIDELCAANHCELIEHVKSTNVDDLRVMTTIVMQKLSS